MKDLLRRNVVFLAALTLGATSLVACGDDEKKDDEDPDTGMEADADAGMEGDTMEEDTGPGEDAEEDTGPGEDAEEDTGPGEDIEEDVDPGDGGTDADGGVEGMAMLRVVHASYNAGPVDLYVNGDLTAEDLDYTGTFPDAAEDNSYVELPSGTYDVAVVVADGSLDTADDVAFRADLELMGDMVYTAWAHGSPVDGSLAEPFDVAVHEDTVSESADQILFQFHHGALNVGGAGVDVYANGGDSPFFEAAFYGDSATADAEVPQGSYTFDVTGSGSTNTLVQYTADLSAAAGTVSLFATGNLRSADGVDVLAVLADNTTVLVDQNPRARVIHLNWAPSLATVDVFLDGAADGDDPVFADVNYLDNTTYAWLEAGTYDFDVYPDGATVGTDMPVDVDGLDVAPGESWTVFVYGPAGIDTPVLFGLVQDDYTPTDMIRGTAVHAAPAAGAVTVVSNSPEDGWFPLIEDFVPGEVSEPLVLVPGVETPVGFDATGDLLPEYISRISDELPGGTVATLFAVASSTDAGAAEDFIGFQAYIGDNPRPIEVPFPPTYKIRVAHAADTVEDVDVYVAGTAGVAPPVVSELGYQSASDYVILPAFTLNEDEEVVPNITLAFDVFVSGETETPAFSTGPITFFDPTTNLPREWMVVAYEDSDGAPTATVVEEHLTAPELWENPAFDGAFVASIVHAADIEAAANVFVTAGTEPLSPPLAPGDTYFAVFPEDDENAGVPLPLPAAAAAGIGLDLTADFVPELVYDLSSVIMEDGAYTIIATNDSSDEVFLFVVEDDGTFTEFVGAAPVP